MTGAEDVARTWLTALEGQYDPGTKRVLAERGLRPGWRCLEVGGGSGSIAIWLADQVAPDGQVVVTDRDTRFLDPATRANLLVLRHDITADPLPAHTFDLIHSRLLLEHLPGRERVLQRLAAALTVGGWLVVEENDNISVVPDLATGPLAALHAKVRRALTRYVIARTGRADSGTYGRQLWRQLAQLGLTEIGAEGRVFMQHGGQSSTLPTKLLLAQVGAALVAAGDLADTELAAFAALQDDPTYIQMGSIMMATWGRRPPRSAPEPATSGPQLEALDR